MHRPPHDTEQDLPPVHVDGDGDDAAVETTQGMDQLQDVAEQAVPARRRLTPSGLRIPPQLRVQREDVTRWWQTHARSEFDRALQSERYFWAKFAVLMAMAGLAATVGIRRVHVSSAGLQTAYDLVQVSHQLRDRRERNRALEARITGLKNPVDLRREGYERYDMRAPAPEEYVLVGDREPPPADPAAQGTNP